MKLRVVLENHSASYADSIKVAKGEFLSLTGREDVGDGHRWLWATADDCRVRVVCCARWQVHPNRLRLRQGALSLYLPGRQNAEDLRHHP